VLILYRITIPKTLDEQQFIEFIREKYFPAVHRGPTRVGQIMGVRMLHPAADTDSENSLYLLVDFDGLAIGQIRVDDESVVEEMEKLGAVLTRLGAFDESDVWQVEPA
jgi:hypothetical protein